MVEAIVLAGGIGRRMKSGLNKLLHPVCGKPLIFYTLSAVKDFAVHVVVNDDNRGAIESIAGNACIHVQVRPAGTADAVKTAMDGVTERYVLIIGGDTPLVEREELLAAKDRFLSEDLDVLVFCAETEDPRGYGRVIRVGESIRVVEEADADASVRGVNLVNGGVYFVKTDFLRGVLNKVESANAQGEFYLPDILRFTEKSELFRVSPESVMGVNTRKDLDAVRSVIQRRILDRFDGVTFIDRNSVYVDYDVELGDDTTVFPGVYLRGKTSIGSRCVVDAGCVVEDSVIRDNVHIKPYSVIEGSEVKPFAVVGPFAHLRPGSVIGEEAKIGNFVETKKAIIGRGSKASHLTYLGDAELGEGVNVGCGTITCNYDGYKKNRTVIGDRVFIGSDTQLVAPVEVEHDAYIAAGTTVTRKVDAYSLAISRVKQVNIQGWVKKYRERMEK